MSVSLYVGNLQNQKTDKQKEREEAYNEFLRITKTFVANARVLGGSINALRNLGIDKVIARKDSSSSEITKCDTKLNLYNLISDAIRKFSSAPLSIICDYFV